MSHYLWGMPTEPRFINPLTDFGFKRLFGTEPSKEILRAFLNALLPERHQVASLTLTNSERLGLSEIDRKAIFDVYCVGKNGERFIVELQKAHQRYFTDRSVFYSSFLIQSQGQKNEWNFKLAPIYTVCILDFKIAGRQNHADYRTLVELKDENGKVFFDKLKYIYLELPKFKKEEHELDTDLERWLYLLRNLWSMQEIPKLFPTEVVEDIKREAELSAMTRDERFAYEQALKVERDLRNVMDYAVEEAAKKAAKKAAKEATKAANIERTNSIARKLLAQGVEDEVILAATGLSLAKLNELRSIS